MLHRDTSRDKKNFIKTVLAEWPRTCRFIQRIGWLNRAANALIIHRAIMEIPSRPNPLCCGWAYTTWEGLTNRRWSSRHLPPKPAPANLPPADAVAHKLFGRANGAMIESKKSTLLFPYFAQWFTDGFLAADQVDRRCNHSRHEIDLSQLYGLNYETTQLIREKAGGRLKSQQIDGAEFPPFALGSDGWLKPEFRKRRTTFRDFAEMGTYPLAVEQRRGEVGSHLSGKPLKPSDYSDYAEPPDPAYPDYRPSIPSFLLYNELHLGSEEKRPDETPEAFEERRRSWFALANDRGNSTPGFLMMTVLMLREHNRIARLLEQQYGATAGWDDERIFQTTRNIMIVIVMKIVIEEYINHITPYHFKLFVDPAGLFKPRAWKWTNWMTLEFNLLYRWHSMIPGALKLGTREVDSRETLWNPRLIIDEGLAEMFNHTTRQPAGRIGAKNTWEFLVHMAEAPTIQMARDAEVASYNDYREMCKMPRVTSFEQISSDPAVLNALKELYPTVDDIEFYSGLFAEDLRKDSALAPLVGTLVGIDAFSQALTNPLLHSRTFNAETFSALGWEIIQEPQTIERLVRRNTPEHKGDYSISMTRADWKHS
jgi:prostaglandin-endoperoxide synthase 2